MTVESFIFIFFKTMLSLINKQTNSAKCDQRNNMSSQYIL